MSTYRPVADYVYKTVLYTVISLFMFGYQLLFVLNRTDYGSIFTMLGTLLLMVGSGAAALTAAVITLRQYRDRRSRLIASVCLILLVAAGLVYVVSARSS